MLDDGDTSLHPLFGAGDGVPRPASMKHSVVPARFSFCMALCCRAKAPAPYAVMLMLLELHLAYVARHPQRRGRRRLDVVDRESRRELAQEKAVGIDIDPG
jgi:hypothetical protein